MPEVEEATDDVVEEEVESVYEMAVWQRGPKDWCWKIRQNYTDGIAVLIDGGTESNRKKAKEAAKAALADYVAEMNAKWVAVQP